MQGQRTDVTEANRSLIHLYNTTQLNGCVSKNPQVTKVQEELFQYEGRWCETLKHTEQLSPEMNFNNTRVSCGCKCSTMKSEVPLSQSGVLFCIVFAPENSLLALPLSFLSPKAPPPDTVFMTHGCDAQNDANRSHSFLHHGGPLGPCQFQTSVHNQGPC